MESESTTVQRGRLLTGSVLAALFTAVLTSVFAALFSHGLYRPDALDYAQIARELLSGNGFTSRQAIYALHLRFLHDHALVDQPWPNLHRFPLPSVAQAIFFQLFGAQDRAVIAYGIFFNALTSSLLYLWARTWIGLVPALGVVMLFTFNAAFLENGCSGLAEPPVVFFFTLALYCTFLVLTRRGGGAIVAIAGLALALAALGRTNILFVAPVLLLGILLGHPRGPSSLRRGLVQGLVFASIVGLVLAPWLIRNALVAGSPLFSLHSYFLLPASKLPDGDKWNASLPWVQSFVSPREYAGENLALVLAKWRFNATTLLTEFPWLGYMNCVSVVALLAFLVHSRSGIRALTALGLGCFLVNAILVCFTDTFFDKYHYHFLPLWMLLAVGVLTSLLARIHHPPTRTLLFFGSILVLLNPLMVFEAARSVSKTSRIYRPRHMQFIREQVPEDGIVFADRSYLITWLTGHRTVRSHYRTDDRGEPELAVEFFQKEFGVPVDGVYLSPKALSQDVWKKALRNSLEDPWFRKQFPERRNFPDGTIFLYR